ncbi:MAG: fimbrillin family protein [Bacteroidales bacterium]|nr:fimbrillin family protein [Bacteroidales bacterium]
MKKTLVFAALASVALVGCTKNVEVANNDLNEITFETPVLAPATKADEITGTTFPKNVDFAVFAWYNATELSGTDVAAGNLYMKDVTVNYDPTKDDNTTGKGAWKPASVYFWPKNGFLAFDAYSPSSVAATCDATKGIAFTNFEASTDYDSQIDLLYSTRVINKQSSVENTNDKYDGVNIPFNHALSVVRVFVKASTATDANLIKVKSIKVKNIMNKGDFASAAWTPKGAAVDVVLGEATTATASTPITTAEAQYGNNRIVLPQDFYGSTAEIEIKYYILGQNGEEALEQVAHFALSGQTAVKPGSDPVDSHDHEWKMGKRYNYHITFGLNEIYFAPSITDWVDYDVTVPTID